MQGLQVGSVKRWWRLVPRTRATMAAHVVARWTEVLYAHAQPDMEVRRAAIGSVDHRLANYRP